MADFSRTAMAAAALRYGVPHYMVEGLVEFMVCGRPVGNFLAAFLSNDLMEAMRRADDANAHAFRAYAMFLYNAAPAGSYGSPDNFEAWGARGGLLGRASAGEG